MGCKKTIHITVILLCISVASHAQNFNEWFRQNRTQIRYLTEQIIAYRMLNSQTNGGYNIMQHGLGMIQGFASGEFGEHRTYMLSLEAVSPEVRNHKRVSGLMELQARYLEEWQALSPFMSSQSGLTPPENNYASEMRSKISDQASKLSSEFQDVVTNSNLQMTDAERIERIDFLYRDYLKNYLVLKRLGRDIRSLSQARQRERNDMLMLEEIY